MRASRQERPSRAAEAASAAPQPGGTREIQEAIAAATRFLRADLAEAVAVIRERCGHLEAAGSRSPPRGTQTRPPTAIFLSRRRRGVSVSFWVGAVLLLRKPHSRVFERNAQSVRQVGHGPIEPREHQEFDEGILGELRSECFP